MVCFLATLACCPAQFPPESGLTDPTPKDYQRVTTEVNQAIANATATFDTVESAKSASEALELMLIAGEKFYLWDAVRKWLIATGKGLGEATPNSSSDPKHDFGTLKSAAENLVSKYNTSPSVLKLSGKINESKNACLFKYAAVDRLYRNGRALASLGAQLFQFFDQNPSEGWRPVPSLEDLRQTFKHLIGTSVGNLSYDDKSGTSTPWLVNKELKVRAKVTTIKFENPKPGDPSESATIEIGWSSPGSLIYAQPKTDDASQKRLVLRAASSGWNVEYMSEELFQAEWQVPRR